MHRPLQQYLSTPRAKCGDGEGVAEHAAALPPNLCCLRSRPDPAPWAGGYSQMKRFELDVASAFDVAAANDELHFALLVRPKQRSKQRRDHCTSRRMILVGVMMVFVLAVACGVAAFVGLREALLGIERSFEPVGQRGICRHSHSPTQLARQCAARG